MESKHLILLGIYLVPYLVTVFLPNWRAISAALIAAIGFGIWLFVFKANEGGGIGLTIEVALLGLMFFGAFSGAVTRALILYLHRFKLPAWLSTALGVLGFFIAPIVIVTLGLMN